jgi:hypothetical protein
LESGFLFALHANTSGSLQESCAASPEDGNTKPGALPATAGCEERLGKYCEHSEREPTLAVSWGKVAKSAEARNSDTAERYNG